VDKFQYSKGWDLYQGGGCLWCPEGDDRCDSHHESPINLLRSRAISTSDEYNACIDVHWMQYHDSSCTFDQLKEQNGFRIDRHALKVIQPIVLNSTGSYVLNCQDKGKSWGRIDFSRGFSAWWYLSHIDLHVPSEHVQEGKRYDAELQMYHFYSKSGEEAGVDNQVRWVLALFVASIIYYFPYLHSLI
jgi:Eukaryotic-type carbonic anhydrase